MAGFFGNVLNGIPVVGHIKGYVHLMAGEPFAAREAFDAATRSSGVMVGGAIGMVVGGPVGMVVGGSAAGTAMDAVASVSYNEPIGVIGSINNVIEACENGNNPIVPALGAALQIGSDAIGGSSGGCIASITTNVGKNATKSVVNEVIKEVVQQGGKVVTLSTTSQIVGQVGNKISESEQQHNYITNITSKTTQNSSTKSNNSTSKTTQDSSSKSSSNNKTQHDKKQRNSIGSGSGSEPPDRQDNNKSNVSEQLDLAIIDLLDFFGVTHINDIVIGGVHIFREITGGLSTDAIRLNVLIKLIKALKKKGIFASVMETVRNIFRKMNKEDVNFQNFISICEMIAVYICERQSHLCERQMLIQNQDSKSFYSTRAENLASVLRSDVLAEGSRFSIYNIMLSLRERVAEVIQTIDPTFANDITATYHYFKHKFVPDKTELLTLQDYIHLISFMLDIIKQSPQFENLQSGQRTGLRVERYFERYGRRFRMVFKRLHGAVVLASCYFIDKIFDTDKDGDIYYL